MPEDKVLSSVPVYASNVHVVRVVGKDRFANTGIPDPVSPEEQERLRMEQ
jgi:hypothetical protein